MAIEDRIRTTICSRCGSAGQLPGPYGPVPCALCKGRGSTPRYLGPTRAGRAREIAGGVVLAIVAALGLLIGVVLWLGAAFGG